MINGAERHVIGYMKDFLFAPEQINTPLSALSGGERARVMLARALALPSNLLVLDEPTNDLDMETLDLMEETIAAYEGTVILVSHDRDFIDRVATLTIISDGDGKWPVYAGGYTDMAGQRGHGIGQSERQKPSDDGPPKGKRASTTREKPAPGPAKRQKKLSFHQQHDLATLPAKMEKLQLEIVQAQKKLADPDLFRRDPDRFHRISASLETLLGEQEQMENRWLEMEILREELEEK